MAIFNVSNRQLTFKERLIILIDHQSEVDNAIQQLKKLKAEADVAQKVGCVCGCVSMC